MANGYIALCSGRPRLLGRRERDLAKRYLTTSRRSNRRTSSRRFSLDDVGAQGQVQNPFIRRHCHRQDARIALENGIESIYVSNTAAPVDTGWVPSGPPRDRGGRCGRAEIIVDAGIMRG